MSIFRRRTPPEPQVLTPGPYGYRVWEHDGLWWWEVVNLAHPSPYLAFGEETEAVAVAAAIQSANYRNSRREMDDAARAARDATPIIGGEPTGLSTRQTSHDTDEGS